MHTVWYFIKRKRRAFIFFFFLKNHDQNHIYDLLIKVHTTHNTQHTLFPKNTFVKYTHRFAVCENFFFNILTFFCGTKNTCNVLRRCFLYFGYTFSPPQSLRDCVCVAVCLRMRGGKRACWEFSVKFSCASIFAPRIHQSTDIRRAELLILSSRYVFRIQ